MIVTDFIHALDCVDLPLAVQHQAVRCLLDTIGTAIAGRQTDCSRIIYDFAAVAFGGGGARLWVDGRFVSPSGAALAHGMTIDSLDIHDGYNLVKGHIGAAIIPAVLATLGEEAVSGKELLTSIAIGYEIAGRAGRALHGTACDYHTSGAWNALGAAAVTARRLKLSREQTRHALGIAEYHGPRSQMMRCIDHPTMVKDGSGWDGRSQRRHDGAGWFHRCASHHNRGGRCSRLLGRFGPALADIGSIHQALRRLPLGAAGHRGRFGGAGAAQSQTRSYQVD